MGARVGTNDHILIVVALFFGLLLLAIHQEEKRTTDRRLHDIGPPDGIERRINPGRREKSWWTSMLWLLGSRVKMWLGLGKGKS